MRFRYPSTESAVTMGPTNAPQASTDKVPVRTGEVLAGAKLNMRSQRKPVVTHRWHFLARRQ